LEQNFLSAPQTRQQPEQFPPKTPLILRRGDSSVSIVTIIQTVNRVIVVRFPIGERDVSLPPKETDHPRGTPILLFDGYR
jgi:hypothetical protein